MSNFRSTTRRAAPRTTGRGPLLAAVALLCAGLLAGPPASAQVSAVTAIAAAKAKKPKVHLLRKAVIRQDVVLCKAQQRKLAKAQVVSYGRSARQSRRMDACTSQGANTP